jgi:Helicase conserved C-terminal domain
MSTKTNLTAPPLTSVEVRKELVEALRLDLVGPWPGHRFEKELLKESPTRWYLTGYLVPEQAPEAQKHDAGSNEEVDAGGDGGGADDNSSGPEKASQKSFLPSSLGLSVLVPQATTQLIAEVTWGDYVWEDPQNTAQEPEDQGPGVPELKEGQEDEGAADAAPVPPPLTPPAGKPQGYRRIPNQANVSVPIPKPGSKTLDMAIPDPKGATGLKLVVSVREVAPHISPRLPQGTRMVCVFIVNARPPAERAYQANAFQVQLKLRCEETFIARPDLRSGSDNVRQDDFDEQVADLHYRNCCDYVSGLGCAAEPVQVAEGNQCREVQSCWIPAADVEFTGHLEAESLPGVELGMEALAELTKETAPAKLSPLVTHYRNWSGKQEQAVQKDTTLEKSQRETATELIAKANLAAKRMEAGIESLQQPDCLEAFRLANKAMARQARQREAQRRQCEPAAVTPPAWRAFQLGFLLLNLRGLADPTHADRNLVDLLFFPTGGGKTEAYLGLAAFSLVLRRLRNPGIMGAGMDVLMRYTLRLLTLDQLSRAAALICALELERQERAANGDGCLGTWPFEIGLWVGNAATPNRMGGPGDKRPGPEYTAYSRTRRFKSNSKQNPSPIPLENCPWCGQKFEANAFSLEPDDKKPTDLRIICQNPHCAFTGNNRLPIVAVDEPIYRRLPCFIIATVDKFASLPWIGESGKLFGWVDRYDDHGFYGPTEPTKGKPLGAKLPPPGLIIQDELHLISGPLGTIAGVYETTIGILASRPLEGKKKLVPKIVASTATVRQAGAQIRALFGRPASEIFPPVGPTRDDAFFSNLHPASQTPARLYLGIAAQGRSLKVILLRTALALLAAGERLYKAAGGASPTNPADPYMTLVGYFNSLRELGGSRRITEDEVRSRLQQYDERRRLEPVDTLFRKRTISYEPVELTSRVTTDKVADAKRKLAQSFDTNDAVDVALATNMISVGLDITRLGLMLVLGQPKTSSEYIQATSRVGRDPKRPGLIVTLFNVHKARDRSHYERFGRYHQTFYRNVEATSVTPFSPRALDRALASAVVALARHQTAALGPAAGAASIRDERSKIQSVAEQFGDRAANHRVSLQGEPPDELHRLRDHVRQRCIDLLDAWFQLAESSADNATTLQYGTELENQPPLLHSFLENELPAPREQTRLFRSNRSMRDVEPAVNLLPKKL